MPTEVLIGVNNAPPNPEFFYTIGVCGQPLQPYTGNPTSATTITVDLEEYGWTEGDTYCYEIAELTTLCGCSGSDNIPSNTPTNTPTNTLTPTSTVTPTITPSETDDMLYFTLTACTISDINVEAAQTGEFYCNAISGNTTAPVVLNDICDLAPIADPVTGNIDDDQLLCYYQYYMGSSGATVENNLQLLDTNDDGVISTSDLLSFLGQYGSLDILEQGYCTSYPTEIKCTNNLTVGDIYYSQSQNACYVVTNSVPYEGQPVGDCQLTSSANYNDCTTCEDENVHLWQLEQYAFAFDGTSEGGFDEKTVAFGPNLDLDSTDNSITGASYVFVTVLGVSDGGPAPDNTQILQSYTAGTLHIDSSDNSVEVDVEFVSISTTSSGYKYAVYEITNLDSYTNEPPFGIDLVTLSLFPPTP